MAKPPAWMHVSEQRVEGNKVFVNIRVQVRHPAFLWMLWRAFRQEARRTGYNPNDARVLWVTVMHLLKIIVRGEL